MSEILDLKNIIEIELIRNTLINQPDLLSMFELLIIVANKRLNEERVVVSLPIEKYEEPVLSDHESDEEE
tara:strand:+ start:17363 stop:17572 length:210 start_codon:yes stop_codon:yes gene_type:complete